MNQDTNKSYSYTIEYQVVHNVPEIKTFRDIVKGYGNIFTTLLSFSGSFSSSPHPPSAPSPQGEGRRTT